MLRSRVARLLVVVLVASGAIACGGRERRADRLWRQAQERIEKSDTDGAIVLMQKIIDEYPDAEIAAKARDQIVLYRGLAHAVESYPARQARDTMIRVARAIESFHARSQHWPSRLEDLVPGSLPEIPKDPWGHGLTYEVTSRGYRLVCLGADGAVGGAGEAEDITVVDGRFVAGAP
ncbi:MAG TPA: type II secretion system protein GspG [Candidatus Polarisedimenticolaceae bacterium]|nr:type II secretion system protein GspG [Candidatus Polarisedimenticolaceae bacterium]